MKPYTSEFLYINMYSSNNSPLTDLSNREGVGNEVIPEEICIVLAEVLKGEGEERSEEEDCVHHRQDQHQPTGQSVPSLLL